MKGKDLTWSMVIITIIAAAAWVWLLVASCQALIGV